MKHSSLCLKAIILGFFLHSSAVPVWANDPDAELTILKAHRGRTAGDRDSRVAIIGAGASGLTAAYELQKKGFTRITLYEGDSRIGGKVKTIEVDGREVELGAVIGLKDIRTLYRMAHDLGIAGISPLRPHAYVVTKNLAGEYDRTRLEKYWGGYSRVAVALGLVRFSRIVFGSRFKTVFRPGYYDLDPDLVNLTTAEFARKYRFESILEPIHAFCYMTGYGELDEVPAMFHMKLMKSLLNTRIGQLISFGFNSSFYAFDEGFLKIWEGVRDHLVANGLDLRLGSMVTHVERKARDRDRTSISVTAGGTIQTFDRLIVTTSPDQTLQYMDSTPDERELFSRVSYFNYHTVVFKAEGLNEDEWVMLRDNMSADRNGHLFTYYHDDPGTKIYTGYQFNDWSKSQTQLNDVLRQDIAELGGSVTEIVTRESWKYFPHMEPESLDVDYYPRLNALQGQNGTYYLGGLFAFETTTHCAQFAEWIVNNY